MNTAPPYPVQQTRKPRLWMLNGVLSFLLLLTALWITKKTGNMLPMFLSFPIAALWWFWAMRKLRCPECQRPTRMRRVRRGDPDGWQCLYDCSHCKVTWDPNLKWITGT